jgi:hypothetical protein
MFSEKQFYDNDSWVAVSGTLTGPSMAYPNNTYAMTCFEQGRQCVVSYIEQIGRDQVGRMENPWIIPIVKWDKGEVVAQDEPSTFSCFRTTVTIDRFSKAVAWVEVPVNQTKPDCLKTQSMMRKYSIEDSPDWKRVFGKR